VPAAARKGDAGVPHCGPYVIATGSSDVIINGRGAARVGDTSTSHLRPAGRKCAVHAPPIIRGSASVIINGRPAARVGDALSSCTLVASGSSDVIIGG
jgi:uncharacterized Zn-binding protein involved in type VI secretion